MLRRVASVLMVGLLACPAAGREAAPPTEMDVLQDNGSRLIAVLPNDMIVVAQEIPTAPVSSAHVWLRAGSIHEDELLGKGVSHYLEHLVSAGSTSTMTEEASNALLGAMGAQTNAATSLGTVRYYINTTSSHTADAIDRLADWVLRAKMDQKEVDREMAVITNEINMGQGDPGRIFWKLTQQTRYQAHPARHPTIGYKDEFLTTTRDEIVSYYQKMYVPNNMVFVVAGDIDRHAVVKQVAELFKDVPARAVPGLEVAVEPEVTAPREVVGYADIQRPRLRMMWPGVKLGADGDYALDLLGSILGRGESSRLVRTIRDQDKLVTSIDAYNASFSFVPGFFGVDAEIAPPPGAGDGAGAAAIDEQAVGKVREAVLAQIRAVIDQPVTEAELDRAKRKIVASIVQANQTAQGVASRIASDILTHADPDYLPRYAEAIQKLTPADLQAAARKFLDNDHLMTVLMLPLPEGDKITPLERVDSQLDGPTAMETVDLNNAPAIADLKARLASPDEGGLAITIDDPVMYTLDNGLRLIVQRSTLVPAVSMQMYWLGGLLGEEPGREGVANATAAMMMKGAGDLSAQQIAAMIEDRGATLGTSSGNNTTFARATALVEDYPDVLDLMADVVLRPAFPQDEWAKMKPRLVAAIERQTDSWSGELMQRFREAYFGDRFPWSQSPLGRRDVVASLTVDDLKTFHVEHLGAKNTVMAVVGDVDPETVKRQVEARFAAMPADAAKPFDPPSPPAPTPGVVEAQTDKPLTAVAVGLGPGITRTSPDYAPMRVLSAVMSDFPAGWIQRALRGEGDGLVYAAYGYAFTGLEPGYYLIAFNTTPAQAPEALERTDQIIARARTEPIGDADLQRAKAKVLTNEFFSKQSNSDRATTLALDELYGVDDPDGKRFLADVENADAQTLMRMAERYLVNPVTVVMSRTPVQMEAPAAR